MTVVRAPSGTSGGDTATTDPTFSILTPVYHTTPYVGRTIRSVLDQTRSDWELLIVDNACPAGGADAVRPFLTDPRVSMYTRDENHGVAVARNAILPHARGRYVVQLDSDDWLEPDYLESVAAVLDADPGAAVAAPDAARYLDETGDFAEATMFELCQAPPVDDHGTMLEGLLRVNYIPPPFTVRRDVLEDCGGWDVEHDGIEDLALLSDAICKGWRVHTIRRPICVYRVRAQSTAFDAMGEEKLEVRQLRERFLDFTRQRDDVTPGVRRQARTSLSRSRVRTAMAASDPPEVRRALWKALRERPSLTLVATALAYLVAPGATARTLRRR